MDYKQAYQRARAKLAIMELLATAMFWTSIIVIGIVK